MKESPYEYMTKGLFYHITVIGIHSNNFTARATLDFAVGSQYMSICHKSIIHEIPCVMEALSPSRQVEERSCDQNSQELHGEMHYKLCNN